MLYLLIIFEYLFLAASPPRPFVLQGGHRRPDSAASGAESAGGHVIGTGNALWYQRRLVEQMRSAVTGGVLTLSQKVFDDGKQR